MKSDKSRKRFVFLCVAPATILFFHFYDFANPQCVPHEPV